MGLISRKQVTVIQREETSPLALFLEYLLLAVTLVLLIPAGVLLITKDSRPGDRLYSYKLQIEKVGLTLVRGTSLEEPLQKLILGRRMDEKKLDK